MSINGGVIIKKNDNADVRPLSLKSGVDVAREQIHATMAMDEMRYVHTVAIVLNCRKNSRLYEEIFNESKEMEQFNKKIAEAGLKISQEQDEENLDGTTGGHEKPEETKKAEPGDKESKEEEEKYPYKE